MINMNQFLNKTNLDKKRNICMEKKINEYLNYIGSKSLDVISCEDIYKELICYNSRKISESSKCIEDIFENLSFDIRKYIKLQDQTIIISNNLDIDNSKKMIELGIFNKLTYITDNINKLIIFLNKKKIRFSAKLKIYDNVGYMSIVILDSDDALKVIDFVNCKLNKYIYNSNPLFFSYDNVMVSLYEEYSYIELLSKYLYNFILDMRKYEKEIDYNNFKDYMIDNYFKINNQIDMYKYLDFNSRNIKLSTFFANLDEITNIIIYLFNGRDFDDFKSFFHKLKKKKKNVYENYDDFSECNELFKELIEKMFLNYGEEYARTNIINYLKTGNSDYITRKADIRNRVVSSSLFMIYLHNISIDEELDKIINSCKFEIKKKILEDVCKETFKNYCSENNKNFGKMQVAIGLIRMECGDYSVITRNNDARKIAIDNIKPNDVLGLIKSSLGIDYVRKVDELYELYANYIEKMCIG